MKSGHFLGMQLFVFEALQIQTVGPVNEINHRSGQQHGLPLQEVIRKTRDLRHGRATQIVGQRPEVALPPNLENTALLGQSDGERYGNCVQEKQHAGGGGESHGGVERRWSEPGGVIARLGHIGGHNHGTDVEDYQRRTRTPRLIPVAVDQRHYRAQHDGLWIAQVHDSEQHEQKCQRERSGDARNVDPHPGSENRDHSGSRRT